jgi:hypothetical protein
VVEGLHTRLKSERSGVQIPVKAFFFNCLSQINIELNFSVAISLIHVIVNLLQLKHWNSIGGTIQITNWFIIPQHLPSDILRPKQIQRLLCFDIIKDSFLYLVLF